MPVLFSYSNLFQGRQVKERKSLAVLRNSGKAKIVTPPSVHPRWEHGGRLLAESSSDDNAASVDVRSAPTPFGKRWVNDGWTLGAAGITHFDVPASWQSNDVAPTGPAKEPQFSEDDRALHEQVAKQFAEHAIANFNDSSSSVPTAPRPADPTFLPFDWNTRAVDELSNDEFYRALDELEALDWGSFFCGIRACCHSLSDLCYAFQARLNAQGDDRVVQQPKCRFLIDWDTHVLDEILSGPGDSCVFADIASFYRPEVRLVLPHLLGNSQHAWSYLAHPSYYNAIIITVSIVGVHDIRS